MFLAVCAVAAYVIHTLNLWGPVINMTNAASSQAIEEGKKRLREFLESSDTGRQALGYTGDSLEMKHMNRPRPATSQKVKEEEDLDDI